MSLDPRYVNKWNTWNGNELPDQIIKGVDSLVYQCYDDKNSNDIKQKYLKQKYDALRNSYDNWPSIL